MFSKDPSIAVIGLGYVGLPLAVVLADRFGTVGFDIDPKRIAELQGGFDRTREIEPDRLKATRLKVTDEASDCAGRDIYIVTVPTPIDAQNLPDLSMVMAASETVGAMMAQKKTVTTPIIIFESTVYPGVTEDVCGPIIESCTGLVCGKDFFLAYSPERINPGDREHTIDKIMKVVSGQTPEVLEEIARLYGAITTGGVFRAASIKAAEAAKVIENAQRDINIAFMNEVAQIFGQLGISVWDVLDAARTKWNFMDFQPGLVGGHCIGVDPYYLSHRARQVGHEPKVILAGRGVNDAMAQWIAGRLHAARFGKPGKVLVMGVTFKENVPDLRNSKVADLISALKLHGHLVTIHDPMADHDEALQEHGLKLDQAAFEKHYEIVLLAVPHKSYLDMGSAAIRKLVAPGGILADLKGTLGSDADWTL